MDAQRFRSRALHEGERYGDDPFVFLRELAQNSRDAGASRIEVQVGESADGLTLSFRDDGSGMSFEDARRFLFRLYASSKEGTSESAGRFGVGFWSILRFEPTRFRIESGSETRWAVECAGDLSRIDPVEPVSDEPGTHIVLCRPRRPDDGDLQARIGERLSHYCRYLRCAGRRRRPLPVFYNGRSINEAMTLDGPVTLSFQSREAEGVVGLGTEPRVELYARGLWVSTVSVLEELEPNATSRRPASPGEGLAPVVILNSDALEVVLSRDQPVDSRALRRLLRLARARVDRLVEHAIEGVAPRSLLERFMDRGRAAVRALGGPAMSAVLAGWALVLVASLVALVMLNRPSPALEPVTPREAPIERAKAPSLGQPYRPITGYRGATIDVPSRGGSDWSLTVDSEEILYFRALSLDDYDPANGWQQSGFRSRVVHPDFSCGSDCLNVEMAVGAVLGPLVLPVPTGYRVDPESVTWNGEPVVRVWLDEVGEASVYLRARGMNVLRYRIGETGDLAPQASTLPARAPLSRKWLRVVNRARRQRPRQAVKTVTREVRRGIAYDVSAETAARFESHPGLWTERVISTEAGDCDVKNGLNVLLLRRLEIPARLAVGMVSIGGRARSGLHAWTEYYEDGHWRVADATGRPVGSPPSRLAVSGPAPESISAADDLSAEDLVAGDPVDVERLAIDVGPGPGPATESFEVRPGAEVDPAAGTGSFTTPGRLEASTEPSSPPADRASFGAATDEEPVDGARGEPPLWLSALVILPALALLLLGWLWRRGRVDESLERRGEGAEQRAAVAGMVRELMRGSAGWKGISALGHRRVLPTLSGPPLSLVDALERSRRGRLWAGNRRSLLSRSAAQRGHPVLDLDDTYFGALVRQSFDVVDLGSIEALNVHPLPNALARVLNPFLERHAGISCAWSAALGDRALTEFDLTPFRLGNAIQIPSRSIVINPNHPDVRARIALLEHNPDRALFAWVDWLISQSVACERNAARLREAAAAAVFEEAA